MLKSFVKKCLGREIKKTEDSFLTSIRISVPGMLHEGNPFLFDYAMKHLPSSAPILEIGSFAGLSTVVIGAYLKKHQCDNPFISVDKWEFEAEEASALFQGSHQNYASYQEHIEWQFNHNTDAFLTGIDHTHQKLTSDEFFASNNVPPTLAFAYIDGNHSYDFVKRDVENVMKRLVTGGFMLLDDSADHHPFDVNKFVKAELIHRKDCRVVMKNPNYLIQKI